MSAAACDLARASSSASGLSSAGEGREALATPTTARSARSNSAISRSMRPAYQKKTGARRRPFHPPCQLLEAMRHADEGPIHLRTEERRVAGGRLVWRH